MERKNGGGGEREGWVKKCTTSTATTQVSSNPLSFDNYPQNLYPNLHPNTPQPSPFSVVRPALNLHARPRPQGSGGGGKGGARDVPASRLPPPALSPARRRPTASAPLTGQGRDPLPGPGTRQPSWRQSPGRRRPLSGFPSPPSSSRRLLHPGPAPGARFGTEGPGPQPTPTAGPTLGFPSSSVP